MATLNRRGLRSRKAISKESGPDAHVNRVRHLLDAQLRMEDALEIADEDEVISTMETSLATGSLKLTKAMNDYVQRPFSSKKPSFVFTDEERAALRELRKSIKEELRAPSDLTKEQLDSAIESLVRAFKTTDGNGNGAVEALEWEPKHYRVLDTNDPRYDPMYSSGSDEELEEVEMGGGEGEGGKGEGEGEGEGEGGGEEEEEEGGGGGGEEPAMEMSVTKE